MTAQTDKAFDDKLDQAAYDITGILATKFWWELPAVLKARMEPSDLRQEMLVTYFKRKKNIDREQNYEGYIRTICRSVFLRAEIALFDEGQKFKHDTDYEKGIEFANTWDTHGATLWVFIDQNTPEIIAQRKEDMPNIHCTVFDRVETLCELVDVVWDEGKPLQCLYHVCHKVLNDYSEAEYGALAYEVRKEITELGEKIEKAEIVITGTNRVQFRGTSKKVQELFDSGITTTSAMKVALDKKGVVYRALAVEALVSTCRRKAGLPSQATLKTKLAPLVKEIFDKGRGHVRVDRIEEALKERRQRGEPVPNYSPSYLRFVVHTLRNAHGLTKPLAKKGEQSVSSGNLYNPDATKQSRTYKNKKTI